MKLCIKHQDPSLTHYFQFSDTLEVKSPLVYMLQEFEVSCHASFMTLQFVALNLSNQIRPVP